MNRVFAAIRRRADEAVTRKAISQLDDHLRRDIGLPARDRAPKLPFV